MDQVTPLRTRQGLGFIDGNLEFEVNDNNKNVNDKEMGENGDREKMENGHKYRVLRYSLDNLIACTFY